MLGRIILGAVYGFIASLAWSFALGFNLMSGWKYGIIIGSVLSLIIYLISIAGANQAGAPIEEAYFAANSQSKVILLVAIITALIAWVIRIVFF